MSKPKREYAILLKGEKVGISYAVSPEKAILNYWWKHDKKCSAYTSCLYGPEKYDAVEL